MAKAAEKAGITIVTGDTKVVEKGKCDGVFINTSGIGSIQKNLRISPKNVTEGDIVISESTVSAFYQLVKISDSSLK